MRKAFHRGFNAKYLFEREGHLLYRRSVPKHLRELAGRSEFKESLHTKDPDIAAIRYGEIHQRYEMVMARLRQGIPFDPRNPPRVEDLRPVAESYGFPYRAAGEQIKRDDSRDFARRFGAWDQAGRPAGTVFDAVFGATRDPIRLSDALAFFEEHIRDEMIGLEERAKGKKLAPKRLAVRTFTEFAGKDIDIAAIDRPTALAFRGLLLDRIEEGEIIGGTANKILGNLRQVLNVNIKQRDLQIANPFSELRVKEDKASRPPFSIGYLQDRWFKGSVFDQLNAEARALLFAMADTGCGPKELCGLDPAADIRLDDEIPHIIVRPNQFRKLKTDHRGRTIPLIGYAAKAFNDCPQGFPRYRRDNGSEAASGLLMKYLREHDLLESPQHSVYSLRHTFKDRMRVHQFPSDLQNYLMGHKDPSMGAHYGAGYSLLATREWMEKLEWDWRFNPAA